MILVLAAQEKNINNVVVNKLANPNKIRGKASFSMIIIFIFPQKRRLDKFFRLNYLKNK